MVARPAQHRRGRVTNLLKWPSRKPLEMLSCLLRTLRQLHDRDGRTLLFRLRGGESSTNKQTPSLEFFKPNHTQISRVGGGGCRADVGARWAPIGPGSCKRPEQTKPGWC